ncbi:MAG TPA: hypothetical protein VIT89_11525 [Solirubrobacterales bacterium]
MLAVPVTMQRLRAQLDEHLFPPSPPVRGRLANWERAAVLVALLVLAIVAQLTRAGWQGSLQALWAEDGPIFLQEAIGHGFGETLFAPYSNYLVVVPRLIGDAAALAPLGAAPAVVSILAAALATVSGLFVWQAGAAHIRNPYLRGALVLATVLVPVGGLESVDSASYVSWYMLFACFWILLWRPATWWGTAAACGFLVLTGLSNPGVWFLAPLAVLRALAARDRRDLAILAAFAAPALVQAAVISQNHDPAVDPAWSEQIWTAYLQRVVDGAPFGLHLGGVAWELLGWPLLVALLLAGAAGAWIGLRRAGPGTRWLAAIALPTSLLLFLVSLYQRALGPAMAWPADVSHGNGGRYAIVPVLLVIGVALALIDGAERRRSPRTRISPLGSAAVALIALAVATSFYVGDTAARGTPEWDSALDTAAGECGTGTSAVATVPTSPPGFVMSLPCAEILDR